ncbi:hypothetical protein [Aquimarina sp. 2201CG5-10]|nr:hypothetical protein [Aquimarina sp. 2201CG5-10]MDY8135917.1 hypothetical protein [Aquimarina sp. 2201CG5-10]
MKTIKSIFKNISKKNLVDIVQVKWKEDYISISKDYENDDNEFLFI